MKVKVIPYDSSRKPLVIDHHPEVESAILQMCLRSCTEIQAVVVLNDDGSEAYAIYDRR